MNAYVYQAALWCEDCGKAIMAELSRPEGWPDETTWDSDHYPKGPYEDGGGEADCPQHCDGCGEFLENPLTTDGEKYVLESVARGGCAVDIWRQYYDYLFD